jgi:hypothetical protein
MARIHHLKAPDFIEFIPGSENILAKSQKKSSREVKKPKQDKKSAPAAAPSFLTPPRKK